MRLQCRMQTTYFTPETKPACLLQNSSYGNITLNFRAMSHNLKGHKKVWRYKKVVAKN